MGDEKTPKRTKVPHLMTYRKIGELASYREQYIKERGTSPSLTNACRKILIDYRTVKRHAPQLIEKWKYNDFHW